MSGIYLSGNRLIQRVRDREEELGHIELEPNSESCVLWLKDTFGVASTAGAYIRVDEYPSMDIAKAESLSAPSVFIWHVIWMRGVLKREAEQELYDHWEEFSAEATTVPSKEGLRDRLRGYLDRLPGDKAKELFNKIATEAFKQVIAEIVKLLLKGL